MFASALSLILLAAAPEAGIERRLHAGSVEASSFLFNDWNKFQENYHPLYLADDDEKTAWVEGAKGDGKGEWVRVKVTPLEDVTRVRVELKNGYQKSKPLFAANARAKEVELVLLPGKTSLKATLADKDGWQELAIDQPRGKLEAIELRILSVYAGKKYEDLCISDARIFATAATRDNPAFEKAKLEKILAWKKDRSEAARLFKSASSKSLPVAAQYRMTQESQVEQANESCPYEQPLCSSRAVLRVLEKTAGKGHEESIALAAKVLAGEPKIWSPVQVAVKDKRAIPRVDGLCVPSLDTCSEGCYQQLELPMLGQAGLLHTSGFGTFDVKDQPALASVAKLEPKPCKKDDDGTAFSWAYREKIEDGGAAKEIVRALLIARCGAVEGREGMNPTFDTQLLVYDRTGRLDAVVGRYYANVLEWRDTASGSILARGRRVSSWGQSEVIEEVTTIASR